MLTISSRCTFYHGNQKVEPALMYGQRERKMPWRNVHLLLIEDDEVDVEHFLRVLQHSQIPNPVTVVGNGIEALNVLRGNKGYQRLPQPYVIVLDLNTPRMSGLEFLRAIREDKELRRSLIFVLTTSDRIEDLTAAYDQHVAGYFLKSSLSAQEAAIPNLLAQYWQLVQFPPV
jgi:CheY-like chemotaxis protein